MQEHVGQVTYPCLESLAFLCIRRDATELNSSIPNILVFLVRHDKYQAEMEVRHQF